MHVKQVKLGRINELGGQRHAFVLKAEFQIKVGLQLHCLLVKFAVLGEFSTSVQIIHPKVLSTYELLSGHSHTPVSGLNT